MEEQLLHFIWHSKLFRSSPIRTTQGQHLEIVHPGMPNQDQGPDFLHARIRIDDQLWAGNVEIHVRSSAWFLHLHERDSHYDNVILHVVWKEDQPAITGASIRIPCLELEDKVDAGLLSRYHHLMNNKEWVPCASGLMETAPLIRTTWLERMMAERLEHKTVHIRQILDRCHQHWEHAFFALLSRQLGAPANSDTMEELAIRIAWNTLRKHGDRIDQIEAMLFGTAGMLEKSTADEYAIRLKNEFAFLKKKYRLSVLPGLRWKFMRMRPVHFPTIRLAQLAVMLKSFPHFISLLEQMEPANAWMERFRVSPEDPFWETHYHFTSTSPISVKRIGVGTAHHLIINVVAPMMFLYGKENGKPQMKEHALELLCALPPESNAIIRGWATCGWGAQDAGQSQGLLHLKKTYCDQRKCMHCAIGLQVLK